MLRTGFSTSGCAAAAAVAALTALETGQHVQSVTIDLVTKKNLHFDIARCEIRQDSVLCGVIKDAGDDPDVTDHLEIQTQVRRMSEPGVQIFGGKGVGRVTLPGLPVEVGNAAINPGPRRLILRVFQQAMKEFEIPASQGYELTIIVPEGEEIAKQTLNPKLGIIGGISILGTDGLVHPYSAPAFRASLYYELNVARKKGCSQVAFGTGKRSVDYLQKVIGANEKSDFISVGDELGFPIDQACKMGFTSICVGGMIGKLSKLAQGRFQTHVHEGEVDFDFLAKLAENTGASSALCQEIKIARTARAVQNLLRPMGLSLEPKLAQMAASQIYHRCQRQVTAQVWVFSLEGSLLGYAEEGVGAKNG